MAINGNNRAMVIIVALLIVLFLEIYVIITEL